MDPKEIQRLIERRYLQCIVDLSKKNPLSDDLSRISAQVMQAMRPWNSWDEALVKSEFFVSKFPNFTDVYNYVKAMKDEQDSEKMIDLMHKHLKENDIDSALQVARTSL